VLFSFISTGYRYLGLGYEMNPLSSVLAHQLRFQCRCSHPLLLITLPPIGSREYDVHSWVELIPELLAVGVSVDDELLDTFLHVAQEVRENPIHRVHFSRKWR
jgi:hypothetical protein